MLKIMTLLCTTIFIGTVVSFYTITVPDISFNTISFNNYRNKKVLLVNIASNSPQAGQLAELQQLYIQQQDGLQVVAFPSNSFGNEPKSNQQLSTWLQSKNISFLVAAKSDITGINANNVYKWLANKQQNVVTSIQILTDFEKILIDRNGQVEAIFNGSVNPQSNLILDAIRK